MPHAVLVGRVRGSPDRTNFFGSSRVPWVEANTGAGEDRRVCNVSTASTMRAENVLSLNRGDRSIVARFVA